MPRCGIHEWECEEAADRLYVCDEALLWNGIRGGNVLQVPRRSALSGWNMFLGCKRERVQVRRCRARNLEQARRRGVPSHRVSRGAYAYQQHDRNCRGAVQQSRPAVQKMCRGCRVHFGRHARMQSLSDWTAVQWNFVHCSLDSGSCLGGGRRGAVVEELPDGVSLVQLLFVLPRMPAVRPGRAMRQFRALLRLYGLPAWTVQRSRWTSHVPQLPAEHIWPGFQSHGT
mmetsp:Transcript_24026/g.48491  ORF Transcript_24026/g.48491 Transcript_24026/m.48491 type:complete len:228 (+) Transcript_24026:636-1319(+)